MQLQPKLTSPKAIREALFADPSQVTDPQLLALFLGKGTTSRRRGEPKRTWTTIQLAEGLLKEAGGRLAHLVLSVHGNTIDLKKFGLGTTLGSRLIAAMELAHRWRRGFHRGGNTRIRSGFGPEILEKLFERKVRGTEGELVAIVLGDHWRDHDKTNRLLAAYASPRKLFQSLTPDAFEVAPADSSSQVRHRASGVELEYSACSRLLTAVEMARRHRQRAKAERSGANLAALGLSSPDLSSLVDPESPLDEALRRSLIEVLRSRPGRAEEVAVLDRLAAEAQTESYEKAVELHRMFEALRRSRKWNHPREVLGEPVAYPALLSIAEARIARGDKPVGRMRNVKKLLEKAEREASSGAIEAFVEALLEQGLSEAGADRAFSEARQRYFERRGRASGPGLPPI
ncbi:MAG: hypothetical protein GY719_06270 [bacterium]|nr:hypothetical protein [bacterium]